MKKQKKQLLSSTHQTKKTYQRPSLAVLGNVKTLTLKGGSVSDFGSNQFQA